MKLNFVFYLVALIFILECVLAKDKKDMKGKNRPPPDRKIKGKKGGKGRERAIEARKKGGIVRLLRQKDGKDDEGSAVTAYIKRICEVDKDGKEVGKNGTKRHCFKKFEDEYCEISTANDVKIQGINATTFTVDCKLNKSEIAVKVEVFIFGQDGEIENGDETITVTEGAMKVNVMVQNWTFCGSHAGGEICHKDGGKEEGTNLDVDMHVGAEEETDEKGNKKKGPKPRKTGKATGNTKKKGKKLVDKYEVGNDAFVALPKEYKGDGGFESMEGDFPKAEDDRFIFRFKKFNKTLFYDPVVDYEESSDNSGTASNPAMVTSFISSLILCYFLVF